MGLEDEKDRRIPEGPAFDDCCECDGQKDKVAEGPLAVRWKERGRGQRDLEGGGSARYLC